MTALTPKDKLVILTANQLKISELEINKNKSRVTLNRKCAGK